MDVFIKKFSDLKGNVYAKNYPAGAFTENPSDRHPKYRSHSTAFENVAEGFAVAEGRKFRAASGTAGAYANNDALC